MYANEPHYVNVQRDIQHVKEMDERVINFLHVVDRAPQEIQESTNSFLSVIDKLKKNYVSSIVKCKKVERQFDDSERYLAASQREYIFFKQQDDYLDQISPNECFDAEQQLEKAQLERSIRSCQLQLAVRELELAKEKLCRLGIRAEYFFHCRLQKHSDRAWAHIYRNDSMRPKSELKRAHTIPAVLPKQPLRDRYDTLDRSENDTCDTCDVCSKYNTMQSNKIITRNRACDENTRNRARGDSYLSDDEFPPPPLPDNDHLISDPQKKRFSDRSTVDEGIGDIDWHPFQLLSEDGRGVPSECDVTAVRNDTDATTTSRKDIYEPIKDGEQYPGHDVASDISNISLDTNVSDTEVIEVAGGADLTMSQSLQLDTIVTDDKSEATEITAEPKVMVSSETILTKSTSDDCKRSSKNIQATEIPKEDSLPQVNVSHHASTDETKSPADVTEYDIGNSANEHSVLDSTKDMDSIPTGERELITNTIIDASLYGMPQCDAKQQVAERDEHLYEDVAILHPSRNFKSEKTKKKGKLKFLSKVFHGPWEGWEEL